MIEAARESLGDRHDKAVDSVMNYQKIHGMEETLRRLMPFMVSYLSLNRNIFPEVAKATLAVAEKYYLNVNTQALGKSNEFETARNSCWNYLESTGRTYDFDSREALAVRAALCLLAADPLNNVGETITWFFDFADSVEDHSSETQSLLARYFE
jgi:hypothetical protein